MIKNKERGNRMALFYHPAFCSKIVLRQHGQHCGVADLHKLVAKRAGYARMNAPAIPKTIAGDET
jgi:hypothetical protein